MKARQFATVAQGLHPVEQSTDAFVSLAVLSGIASSDVICCRRPGEYASGQSHSEAVELLAQADKRAARALNVLLGLKASAEYQPAAMSLANCRRAKRAMETLLEVADQLG